jgi:hypothetical protein
VSPTCDAEDVKSIIQLFPDSSQHFTGNSSHSLSDAPLQIDIRTLRDICDLFFGLSPSSPCFSTIPRNVVVEKHGDDGESPKNRSQEKQHHRQKYLEMNLRDSLSIRTQGIDLTSVVFVK